VLKFVIFGIEKIKKIDLSKGNHILIYVENNKLKRRQKFESYEWSHRKKKQEGEHFHESDDE
jgi:hypothetical protein